MTDEPETLFFASQAAWREWLEANHAFTREAWLLISKKGAARKSLTLAEADPGVLEKITFIIDKILDVPHKTFTYPDPKGFTGRP